MNPSSDAGLSAKGRCSSRAATDRRRRYDHTTAAQQQSCFPLHAAPALAVSLTTMASQCAPPGPRKTVADDVRARGSSSKLPHAPDAPGNSASPSGPGCAGTGSPWPRRRKSGPAFEHASRRCGAHHGGEGRALRGRPAGPQSRTCHRRPAPRCARAIRIPNRWSRVVPTRASRPVAPGKTASTMTTPHTTRRTHGVNAKSGPYSSRRPASAPGSSQAWPISISCVMGTTPCSPPPQQLNTAE